MAGRTPIAPGSTIGIVGGGQLGRMLAASAAQLGYRVHIYAPDSGSVAFDVVQAQTIAAYDDELALNGFASKVDVVTFEFENVPVDTITHLSNHRPTFPKANALRVAQDRAVEKQFALDLGIAVPRFVELRTPNDLLPALAVTGYPAILKTAREGYDGKGRW